MDHHCSRHAALAVTFHMPVQHQIELRRRIIEKAVYQRKLIRNQSVCHFYSVSQWWFLVSKKGEVLTYNFVINSRFRRLRTIWVIIKEKVQIDIIDDINTRNVKIRFKRDFHDTVAVIADIINVFKFLIIWGC